MDPIGFACRAYSASRDIGLVEVYGASVFFCFFLRGLCRGVNRAFGAVWG